MKEHKEFIQNWINKLKNDAQSAAQVAYKEATDPQNIAKAMKLGADAQEALNKANTSAEWTWVTLRYYIRKSR